MPIRNTTGFRVPALSALTLAFASFGDAFLYPYLPVQGGNFGIPLMWVGILLSINRFIRIFANTHIVNLFSRYGLRTITILAAATAILSTLGYGFAFGIASWLILRILWGLSFSALRTSAIAYALQHPRQGLSLGVSKSLQESGPVVALFLTPVLLVFTDSQVIFLMLACASFPALYFAWSLPSVEIAAEKKPSPINSLLKKPSPFNLITFSSAFLIDGLIIVTLGTLLVKHGQNVTPISAAVLAATFLGYRRICILLLSSAGGWLADRIGLHKIFVWSSVLTLCGLILLSVGWIEAGALIVFTFYSVQSALAPGSISKQCDNVLFAVAENATWRDLGAAMGTLVAGFLLSSKYLSVILLITTFVSMFLLLFYLGSVQKTVKILLSWK